MTNQVIRITVNLMKQLNFRLISTLEFRNHNKEHLKWLKQNKKPIFLTRYGEINAIVVSAGRAKSGVKIISVTEFKVNSKEYLDSKEPFYLEKRGKIVALINPSKEL